MQLCPLNGFGGHPTYQECSHEAPYFAVFTEWINLAITRVTVTEPRIGFFIGKYTRFHCSTKLQYAGAHIRKPTRHLNLTSSKCSLEKSRSFHTRHPTRCFLQIGMSHKRDRNWKYSGTYDYMLNSAKSVPVAHGCNPDQLTAEWVTKCFCICYHRTGTGVSNRRIYSSIHKAITFRKLHKTGALEHCQNRSYYPNNYWVVLPLTTSLSVRSWSLIQLVPMPSDI